MARGPLQHALTRISRPLQGGSGSHMRPFAGRSCPRPPEVSLRRVQIVHSELGVHRRAPLQDLFIDGVAVVVVAGGVAQGLVPAAQEAEDGGDFVGEEGEVLTAHGHGQLLGGLGAVELLGGLLGHFVQQLVVVDEGAQIVVVLQARLDAQGGGGVLDDAAQVALDGHTEGGVEGPDGAVHHRVVGDDVEPLARVHLAHRDDQGVQRAVVPGDEGLEVQQDGRRADQRVRAQLRLGAVGREALHGDGEVVAAGHPAAGLHVQIGLLQLAPDVLAEDGVHAVHQPMLHVVVRPVAGLLAGLEDQLHLAVDLVLVLHQQLGRAQQHGDVAVVAAGVHHARVLAGEGQPGLLLHGQGIDVGPEGHGPALAAVQHGPAAVVVRIAVDGIAHFLQLRLDLVGGRRLLQGQLGVLVEPAALFDDIALSGFRGLFEIHKGSSLSLCVVIHGGLDVELRAADQRVLVHAEMPGVVHPHRAARLAADAQERHRAGDLLHEIGEVLAAVGLVVGGQGVGADDLLRGLRRQGGDLRRVDHRGHDIAPLQLGLHPVRLGHGLHDPAQAVLQLPADGGVEAAGGAFDVAVLRHHVPAGAHVDHAHRHDGGLVGIHLPADDGLDRLHHRGGGGGGVDALMRGRAVAALAGDVDEEPVGGGHLGARLDGDLSGLHVGPDVHGEASVHAVQRALLDHGPGPGGHLLGGLEGQPHRAAELVLPLVEHLGGGQHHRHVAVMAAGVHHAGDLAGVLQPGLLLHGQPVHVPPEQDGPAGLRALDRRQGAGLQTAGAPLHAHLVQLGPDALAALELLLADLRMLVEPAALFDEIALDGLVGLLDTHIDSSLSRVMLHSHLDAQLHPVDQGGLVHTELGIVLGPYRPAGLAAHAQERQRTGGLLHVAGHVLRPVGLVVQRQGVGPDDLLRRLRRQRGHVRMVDDRRDDGDPLQLDLGPIGLAHGLHHPPHGLLQLLAHAGVEGAGGALEEPGVRHHVPAGARADLAHGHDGGLVGVHLPADDDLERVDQLAAHHHGIDALMRLGAVAALAGDIDLEHVGGGHPGPGLDGDLAGGHIGPHVDAEASVHPVHGAPGDHGLAAGADLLGGLEGQLHGAAELPLQVLEDLGGSQQHRHVAVMAAGVHQSLVLAGVGEACLLLDLQRVHVRAEEDGLARFRAPDRRQGTGLQAAGAPLHAHLVQLGPDVFAALELLFAVLGMPVEPAALFDEVILILRGGLFRSHGLLSFLKSSPEPAGRALGAPIMLWSVSQSAGSPGRLARSAEGFRLLEPPMISARDIVKPAAKSPQDSPVSPGRGSQHLREDAGDDDGGDGHGGEAADDHRGEHAAHQVILLLIVLRQGGAGGLGDDGVGREAVQRRQGRGEGQQEGHLQDLRDDEAANAHAEHADDDQDDHGEDDASQHGGGGGLQAVEHVHHQGEHDDAVRVGLVQGVLLQEADGGGDDGQDQGPDRTADLHVDPGDDDVAQLGRQPAHDHQPQEDHRVGVPLAGQGGDQLPLGSGLGLQLAVDGVHLVGGRDGLAAARAILLEHLLALQLEADGGEGIAGEALDAVHGDGEQGGGLQAQLLGGLLHGDRGDDAAGQRGQAGDDVCLIHHQGADDQAQRAHAGQARQAHHDGLPLVDQLLDADDGAHVGQAEIDADGAAEGDQLGIADQGLGENGPVADQHDHGGDEHRGDPCLGGGGDDLTDHVGDGAGEKR